MKIINFREDYPFNESQIKSTLGLTGLYFIFLARDAVLYPFQTSRLIYIGLSESRHNSIGRRLRAHLTGQSGNVAIKNYASRRELRFTCHSAQLLAGIGSTSQLELESFFLDAFMMHAGAFPICNNQSGAAILNTMIDRSSVIVSWDHFNPV